MVQELVIDAFSDRTGEAPYNDRVYFLALLFTLPASP
jgi:hypothetical protein